MVGGTIPRMAFHTAIGFFVHGVGIITFVWKNEPKNFLNFPQSFPTLLTVGELTFSLFYSGALYEEEKPIYSNIALTFGILLIIVSNIILYFLRKLKPSVKNNSFVLTPFNKISIENPSSEGNLDPPPSENIYNQLQSILQSEREKIARDIHDDLGQSLTILKLGLYRLKSEFPKNLKTIQDQVQPLINLIDETINSVQRIALNLRPTKYDELGFINVTLLKAEIFQHNTGIQCITNIPPRCQNIDREIALSLFRIIQEALTNISRHSKANQAEINLMVHNENILLKIMDNGIGITEDQINHSKSLGISGMTERVKSLGGKFNIIGIPNEGTQINIIIPFKANE